MMQHSSSLAARRGNRPPTPISVSSSDAQEGSNESRASSNSHLEPAEGHDTPKGSLLRRSPRFDDTLERIQEDLGMIEFQPASKRKFASPLSKATTATTSRQREVVIRDERLENKRPLSPSNSLNNAAITAPQTSQETGGALRGYKRASTKLKPFSAQDKYSSAAPSPLLIGVRSLPPGKGLSKER